MDNLLIIYTHNRPEILNLSLNTVLTNTEVQFDEIVIIDDGSEVQTAKALAEFVLSNPQQNISFFRFNKNRGYGVNAEFAWNYARLKNPKYLFHVESDYLLRKDWAKEALAVLKAKPKSLIVPLCSHPDYRSEFKTKVDYVTAILEDCPEDNQPREKLYKPFKLQTEVGEIEVEGCSNTCGCFVANFQNFLKLEEKFPEWKTNILEKAFGKKPGQDRRYYGDGVFSHGSSYYWMKDPSNVEDPNTDFAIYNVYDYALGDHKNFAGLNMPYYQGIGTTVPSHNWNDNYIHNDPRNSNR